jgi:hypothetical protein
MNIKMPDITQAQIIAAATWVIAQVVSWGWIDNNAGQKLLAATSSLIALAWMLADSYLRGQRVKASATALAAGKDLKTGKSI